MNNIAKKKGKILVTGGDGMLANYFKRFSKSDNLFLGKKKLDVSNWREVKKLLDLPLTGIIHLAAITDVDWCEANKKQAFIVNTKGTEHIAEVCRKKNIPLVFTSTSAIFNGKSKVPYVEFDKPDPSNYYAQTKLEAEEIIKELDDYVIVRLGWLIGKQRKFLYYILKQIQENVSEIRAVSDIKGTITYAYDAARFLDIIMKNKEQGIFHFASAGSCTRYELARQVVNVSGKKIKVVPVLNKEFSKLYPAPRSKNESIKSVRKVLNFKEIGRWEKTILDIDRIEGLLLNES